MCYNNKDTQFNISNNCQKNHESNYHRHELVLKNKKKLAYSLPAQVARLEKYCQNKGFEIIKTLALMKAHIQTERDEFDRIIDFIIEQKEKSCCLL